MSRQKPPFFHLLLTTGFGSGFSPVAPGTAGALVAVLLWGVGYFLLPFPILQVVLAVVIVYFTVQGIYSGTVMERYWGEDPSRVVIDEMVGVWIPLLVVPEGGGWYVLAAFVLFRFFDIVKPLGIRRMERFKGGLGIMMDDILAGVYSALLLGIARFLLI
ncbi:MAG: phosphatidylglycerophosphatase A [Porphyromonadaceae bacterium]|nr:phosphatidylglycerophosphatase A [Porphyromonadaceae bacterium]